MLQRNRFTAEQKAAIVRRHLVDRIPIADLCEEHGIRPNIFYRWQKQVFDHLPELFEKKAQNRPGHLEGQIAQLKAQLAQKDAVIAEVTQDWIEAKKKIGGR